MVGVMIRGQPPPFGGARAFLKSRRLERMLIIERLLQPAASAIWDVVSNPLQIISRISSSCEAASRGAIMGCTGNAIDRTLLEVTAHARYSHCIVAVRILNIVYLLIIDSISGVKL